jgi:Zn-dependent peptidase ImmA (M78 family)/transcriptional regulator with XRE-family HTH domain
MVNNTQLRLDIDARSQKSFVGKRLELARTFRKFTLNEVAKEVSVSFGLLGHYERGARKQPSATVVSALATALKVKPDFFYEPISEVWQEQECSFRHRRATPEWAKRRARAHGTLIGMVVSELASHVKVPQYRVPSITARTPTEIESAAEQCRQQLGLGLGPIQQIGRVVETHGVVLVHHLEHADVIDAFARRGNFSVIVLNTVRTSTSRLIYDVAHELGHFVLHDGVETGSKESEDQANYFASAFLLPNRVFAQEFRARPLSWTHVFNLKRRWLVSANAIIRRAYNLSLLDAITYRRCYQHMSQKGWLKEEPMEPEFIGPEWLESAFSVASRKGMTPAVLCERLHWTPTMFTEVTGQPVEVEQATTIQFKPKVRA